MDCLKTTMNYYNDRAEIYDETAGYKDLNSEIIRSGIIYRFRELLKNLDIIEIACGTGYWTKILSPVAKHITAIDISDEMLKLAKENCTNYNNIDILKSDALSLDNIDRKFNAAFHHFWWSHIPRSEIHNFLRNLHKTLENSSLVVMADNSFRYSDNCFYNEEGNRIEKRKLPNGKIYDVIKNIYKEDELKNILKKYTDEINYENYNNKFWIVVYKIKKMYKN